MTTATRFGVLFSGNFPLMRAIDGSVLADKLGYDSAWFGEDYFYQGGIATATAVAERTERIEIGLGILTPLARHPALTVMEVAALDHISAGRTILGYGAGVRYWMWQMNLDYSSPMTALREAVEISRELFAGETSNRDGRFYQMRNVKLGFEPFRADMPTYLGVEGPKMLTLSGEICDGTILSVLASPPYVEFAWENVRNGCAKGGRDPEKHRMVVYVIFAMDEDGQKARDAVRPVIAEYLGAGGHPTPLTKLAGVPDELMGELGRVYREGRIPTELIPDDLITKVAVAGNVDECEAAVRALIEAGADEVVFFPMPSSETESLVNRIATDLLPRVR
ncbi:MAG: LLM class flavin-dependent oxidoreductase [Thermomicrobiales bacterium]|nr:LLM class flavin-dependent oxidoreductase [Thermomicrobiales bacterium]